MNRIVMVAALAAMLTVPAAPSVADEMTAGEVVKIDTRRNRLTIKHGPIENLGMDAMTMVFEVADPAMIEGVSVGSDISFVVERVNGKLTIIEME